MESACKPGSVENNHSSGHTVTGNLKRPTRIQCGPHHRIPIWPCSGRGLPSHRLLPTCAVRSYRTLSPLPRQHRSLLRHPRGGLLSAALSVGSRPPGVTWHPVLWSPDFPPAAIHQYIEHRYIDTQRLAIVQPTPPPE